ncbi:peptide MFS transporter [Baileyella intestinalis]|uniref:Peptide MFS transporter n=1 Tax=Baileyella intestinalis TaxID=2606709 RepID=A0A6A8M8U0_9FIRM|nr:MFS transporter [Baileyella intestinalis]MCI7685138.1 MFS transporter [Clostridiales bacterium]MDD5874467.1 MFS transporter [Baileyella intestinalis]MDY2994546.1 MFS transporter [Baileyella intestinalis]MST69371.1 peptide MFS transporter [Baileyella intestinalis]
MPEAKTTKTKYPFAFWVCGCTEIFERMAFYLGRSLILVFVAASVTTGGLGLSDITAAKMQSNLTAFSYLLAILGGYLVDRWLPPRRTTPIGMLIVATGYFCGSIAHSAGMVYAMIFCVAFGLGLFKTGPMVGRIVRTEDLKSAYSIRYSLVNIGGLIGPLLAGVLYQQVFAHGDILGFRPCFRLASIVMVAGAVWFTLGMHFKGGDAGKKPFKAEKTQEELEREAALKAANKEVKLTLNSNEKKRIWAIILISAFQIIFWLFWYLAYLPAYYHWGTNMTWKVGSFTIPQTWFDAVNALFCIISGPLTAILWHKLESRPQGDMSLFKKLGIALAFLGCGYLFYAGMDAFRGNGKPSCLWLIIFLLFLTLGEMFFSPLGNAFIAEYAPSRLMGVMQSVWGLGLFFAAKLYANVYAAAFGGKFTFVHACIGVAAVAFACTIVLFIMDKPLRSLVEKKEESVEA